MLSTKTAGALIDGAPRANSKGETMVNIKLTRNTVVGGKAYLAGNTVKATKDEARYLIAIKKALPVTEQAPEVENRENDLKVNTRKGKGRNRRIEPDSN